MIKMAKGARFVGVLSGHLKFWVHVPAHLKQTLFQAFGRFSRYNQADVQSHSQPPKT